MMAKIKLVAAGLLALLILGLFGAAAWYRGEAFAAEAKVVAAEAEAARVQAALDLAVETNKENADTIDRMQKQDALNDRISADLMQKLAAANAALMEDTTARADLKGKNETVRSYLDTAVPDDLRRLYDR